MGYGHDHVRRDLGWKPKAGLTGEVCLDERKIEEIGLMGVTPPNSRNLAADDASWLPMVLPAVYNDRRFGRYLGNVDYTGNPTKCYFVRTRVGTRLVGSHVIPFWNPCQWFLHDSLCPLSLGDFLLSVWFSDLNVAQNFLVCVSSGTFAFNTGARA